MSDNTEQTENSASPGKKRRWGKRLAIAAVLIGFGFVPGFFIGAHNAVAWIWDGPHGYHWSDERIARKVDRKVERFLSRIDASPAQETQIKQIAQKLVKDMRAIEFDPWQTRDKFKTLLRAETIDAAAFETLRKAKVDKMDRASQHLVKAMTDAAAVLTPEQRQMITDRKRGWRHWR